MKHLFKIFSLIILAFIITNCTKKSVSSSSKNVTPYNGEWLLTNGNIFDSVLVFKKIEKADSAIIYGQQYTINKNEMVYKAFNPRPRCGNGMFYVDTSSFNQTQQHIQLSIKGGYMVESTFDYKANYTSKNKSENGFTLILKEILIDNKKSFYDDFK